MAFRLELWCDLTIFYMTMITSIKYGNWFVSWKSVRVAQFERRRRAAGRTRGAAFASVSRQSAARSPLATLAYVAPAMEGRDSRFNLAYNMSLLSGEPPADMYMRAPASAPGQLLHAGPACTPLSRPLKRPGDQCYEERGAPPQPLMEPCSVGPHDMHDDGYAPLQPKKSPPSNGKKTKGRVKIKMEYIDNKLRRYTTFSKRKTGIMKKVRLCQLSNATPLPPLRSSPVISYYFRSVLAHAHVPYLFTETRLCKAYATCNLPFVQIVQTLTATSCMCERQHPFVNMTGRTRG